MDTVVVFEIDDQVMALPVKRVQRVIWAVEITALPGQGPEMLGVINVEGNIISVLNIRNLLGMRQRDIELEDHIVIIELDKQMIAMVVDKVEGVLHFHKEQFSELEKQEGYSSGLLNHEGDLLVVLNSKTLLNTAFRSHIKEQPIIASRRPNIATQPGYRQP